MERVFGTSRDSKMRWSTGAFVALGVVIGLGLAFAARLGSTSFAERTVLGGIAALYAICMAGAFIVAFVYSPKAYRLTEDELLIERAVGPKKIKQSLIVSVEELQPSAMRRTWRVGGIGGVFCWHGWFTNKQLGDFYMSATRSDRRILLRTAKQRIVLTPDSPDEFVAVLSQRLRGSGKVADK